MRRWCGPAMEESLFSQAQDAAGSRMRMHSGRTSSGQAICGSSTGAMPFRQPHRHECRYRMVWMYLGMYGTWRESSRRPHCAVRPLREMATCRDRLRAEPCSHGGSCAERWASQRATAAVSMKMLCSQPQPASHPASPVIQPAIKPPRSLTEAESRNSAPGSFHHGRADFDFGQKIATPETLTLIRAFPIINTTYVHTTTQHHDVRRTDIIPTIRDSNTHPMTSQRKPAPATLTTLAPRTTAHTAACTPCPSHA